MSCLLSYITMMSEYLSDIIRRSLTSESPDIPCELDTMYTSLFVGSMNTVLKNTVNVLPERYHITRRTVLFDFGNGDGSQEVETPLCIGRLGQLIENPLVDQVQVLLLTVRNDVDETEKIIVVDAWTAKGTHHVDEVGKVLNKSERGSRQFFAFNLNETFHLDFVVDGPNHRVTCLDNMVLVKGAK